MHCLWGYALLIKVYCPLSSWWSADWVCVGVGNCSNASFTNWRTTVFIQGWLWVKKNLPVLCIILHSFVYAFIESSVGYIFSCPPSEISWYISDSESPSQCDTRSVSGYFPASSSCQKLEELPWELLHHCQGRFYYFTGTWNYMQPSTDFY